MTEEPEDDTPYLTIADAATRLRRSQTTLYRWISLGWVKTVSVLGKQVIRKDDVRVPDEAFLVKRGRPKKEETT